MAIRGVLAGDQLLTVADGGMPVTFAVEPTVPEGFKLVSTFRAADGGIVQSFELAPIQGTAAEAAMRLAVEQAKAMDDSSALPYVALFDQWSGMWHEYAKGDRVQYLGMLWRCLQDHKSQPDWDPKNAVSLWVGVAEVKEDGSIAEWQKDTAYSNGDVVMYDGKAYKCSQGHKSQVGWEPDSTPSLWEAK